MSHQAPKQTYNIMDDDTVGINDDPDNKPSKLTIEQQKAALNDLDKDIEDVHELIETGQLPF